MLGTSAAINGNLATIGGGSYLAGAFGLGGNAVRSGAMIMGAYIVVPVAAMGLYVKRNKNRRCLERANKDLIKSKTEIAKQHAKCDIVYRASSVLDLYGQMFSRFRHSATKLHDQISRVENDFSEAKVSGNLDDIEKEKEHILNSIQVSVDFLKNTKQLTE